MPVFLWVLDEGKFLSQNELENLIRVAERQKTRALKKHSATGVRDCFVIHLALNTGLRIMEIADLELRDFQIYNGGSSLVVRRGKGKRTRHVRFSREFLRMLWDYINWKRKTGEPTEMFSALVYSRKSKGKMSTRGIQKMFERLADKAGIKGHSIHHLRHTYASHLYKASGYNLRLVQKMLGHSSIKTTEIYADVLNPDFELAVNKLYSDLTTPK